MRKPFNMAFVAGALCVISLFGHATGALENPQPGSTQSGIGLISGWNCAASQISVRIDGGSPTPVSYGTPRADTAAVCGQVNTGFGLLLNFNLLGAGNHTIVALADGVQFQSASFKVVTFGQEFLRGAAATAQVLGFPDSGQQTTLQWQESTQGFSIAGSGPITSALRLDGTYRLTRSTVDFLGGPLYDTAIGNLSADATMVIAGNNISQSFTVTLGGQTQSFSATATFADVGAYISINQASGVTRSAILVRGPLVLMATTFHMSEIAEGTEVDQWALVRTASAFSEDGDKSTPPVTPSSLVGEVVARVLQGTSNLD